MNYYIGNMAVSDELYHHGVQGMHWYQRRYQNPDGTLTPLGKIHYGIGNAAKKVGQGAGKAIKTAVDHQADKVKRKHPWMMSDEELKRQTDRVRAENAYLSEVAKKKQATTTRGQKFAADILETSAKTLAAKGIEAAAKKLFAEKPDAVRDLEDVLNDTKATKSEIDAAYSRFKNKKDLEDYKRKAEMEDYKPTSDALDRVDEMSKRELDNYNAWAKSRYGNNKENSSIEKAKNNIEKAQKEEESRNSSESRKIQEREDEIQQRIKDSIEREHRERDERMARERAFEAESRKPDAVKQEQIKKQVAMLFEDQKSKEIEKSKQRSMVEKKRDAAEFVRNYFAKYATKTDPNYYSNYKTTPEFQDAVKRAMKLVEENKALSVSSILHD